jgi:hypothetical protein
MRREVLWLAVLAAAAAGALLQATTALADYWTPGWAVIV